MFFIVLPTLYTFRSDGGTVSPLPLGKHLSFWFVHSLDTPIRILNLISIHNHTMPLHIACMFHINHLHSKLFILAHDMVDREPDNAVSWYAVGVWYLGNQKWATARQYFR